MRINKYLASHGVASRRASEALISNGKVGVNGTVIRDLAFQIDEINDIVTVNGKPLGDAQNYVYYLLNKPKDVISAARADHGETTVVDLIKNESNRIFPVGRLDKDTEGLILLTNDGDLAYRMTHPKFENQKTYEALLQGRVSGEELKQLARGVAIDGKKTAPAFVKLLRLKNGNSLVRITIHEGRNRQIRKMAEQVGHRVLALIRSGEAGRSVDGRNVGEYRKLTSAEVKRLQSIAEKGNTRAGAH
jgi:pseudouridine synthase